MALKDSVLISTEADSGYDRYYFFNGQTSHFGVVGEVYRKSLTRDSVNTPGFKVKRPRLLPMNPFQFLTEEIQHAKKTSSQFTITSPGNYRDSFGEQMYSILGAENSQAYLTPNAAQLSALDARARTDIRLKLKNMSVNLVQAFAERGQTANLIAVTATRIYKSISSLRKGRIVDAADHLGVKVSRRKRKAFNRTFRDDQERAVSRGWLELQYGWLPLLSDIYGSCELLASREFSELVGKVKSKKTFVLEENSRDLFANYDRYKSRTGKYDIKYVIYYSVDTPALHSLSQVGITNPLLIVWELLPWSFVVDWLIPIGNYISSLDATVGLKFLKGTKTTFSRYEHKWTVKGNRKNVGSQVWSGDAAGFKRRVQVVRTKLLNFPDANFPSFKNPVSFTHAANAIALLKQLQKR